MTTDPVLAAAKNITFFTSAPVKESGMSVVTGVAFASLGDLRAGRQRDRWCYVTIAPRGALPRQIELGTQKGIAAPIYTNFSVYPAEELGAVGLSASILQALAKTHCRFAKADPPAGKRPPDGRA